MVFRKAEESLPTLGQRDRCTSLHTDQLCLTGAHIDQVIPRNQKQIITNTAWLASAAVAMDDDVSD